MADEAVATAAAPAVEAPAATEAPAETSSWDAMTEAILGEPEEAPIEVADEAVEAPAVDDKSAAEVPAETEAPDDATPETEEKADGTEVVPEPAAAPVVEFADDDPFDTFKEKADKFYDAYEVDPALLAIKTGYEKQIEALTAQVGSQVEINDGVKAAVEAFTAIDGFRKLDDGRFIPKTNEVIAFVQANKKPEVFKQFVVDAMSAPSEKFKHLGYNMLQEMYIDAGVPPARMQEFVDYVSGDAVPPSLHPDLPDGVPVEVAEAYGKNSALRKLIEENADTLSWSEADKREYPEQYKEAKQQFDDAVAALKAQQGEINRERSDKQSQQQKAINEQQQFQSTVIAGTQEIQKAELANFGKDLSEKLTPFIPDQSARDLQVLAYEQLIVNALSDDIYGESARATLKAQGIPIEFAKAQTLMQQIQDAVAQRQHIFNQTGDKEAADKAVQIPLTNAIRGLSVMRRDVIGKVARVVTKSYNNGGLQPKTDKPTLRPTLKGGRETQVNNVPKVDFTNEKEAGEFYYKTLFGEGV